MRRCRWKKRAGDFVYAGTINQSGALEIEAQKLGRDTTFGRIIEAVERAEKSRAPIQKTADRLAGYLVYFALGAAALTFLITHNARSTISVVIVAGACGIAAGTPLAILGAIGRAAHQGAIIKGGLYLEALAAVDTVLLDKTGTLTFGTSADSGGRLERRFHCAADHRRCQHCRAQIRTPSRQSDYGAGLPSLPSPSWSPMNSPIRREGESERLHGARRFLSAAGRF